MSLGQRIQEMDNILNNPSVQYGSVPRCPNNLESRMRRKLKYFFMNPCQKWQAKKKFPWKLVLQLIKIVLVTLQLALFGYDRSSHVSFLEKNTLSFRHLFLQGWDASYETMPYPPATGRYALYTIPKIYDNIDNVLTQYGKIEDIAVGIYHFLHESHAKRPPVRLCKTHYKEGKILPDQSYIFDPFKVTECFDMLPINVTESNGTTVLKYDTEVFLNQLNSSIHFDRLIRIELFFPLKTVHLRVFSHLDEPDCFLFNVSVLYDNDGHNGQVPVTLKAKESPLECKGEIHYNADEDAGNTLLTSFDVLVIVVSILSIILCLRSLIRAHRLKMDTISFFREHLHKRLSPNDRWEFINMWYVLIIINDMFTIIGSITKILIENKAISNYEVCGVTLGTGNLLVWVGVLRYLGFFKKYNILIVTIKNATPNVLRFLVCAMVFYFGFTFCGWVVLGPYHIKFRDLSTASECLFSLVNGDDMFVTFSAINDANSYVWWYSRIYLYIFISMFIYLVLNVFTSVIIDTYETLKEYHKHGFPKTDLQEFIDGCPDEPNSPLYRSDDQMAYQGTCGWPSWCCCQPNQTEESSEHDNLIS